MIHKILAVFLSVIMLLSSSATVFASEQTTSFIQEQHQHMQVSSETLADSTEAEDESFEEETSPELSDTETSQEETSEMTKIDDFTEESLSESLATSSDANASEEPPATEELIPDLGELCVIDLEKITVVESERIVGYKMCIVYQCENQITVTSKFDKYCGLHKCSFDRCSYMIQYMDSKYCQWHNGTDDTGCAILINSATGEKCKKPSVRPSTCYEHWCQSCDGIKNTASIKCSYCYQCWVIGCPNRSTCGNECNTHCPHNCKLHHVNHRCVVCHDTGNCCACNTCSHTCKTHHQTHCLSCHGAGNCCVCNTCSHTCKTHHQTHCLTCHSDPCVCYPANPNINVGGWNSSNNSITASISSARAEQIEIYTSSGIKVTTINGTSGNFVFYHNDVYNNGEYYVRARNTVGYNPSSFPFSISGLDKAAPGSYTVNISPNGWASSKILTATALDQTSAKFELQYTNGSTVPYCSVKEGTASGGRFMTSWEITEQITSSKDFILVSTDRWGYSSKYNVTINQIDTTPPTVPVISKAPGKEWHNGTVSLNISGSTAFSGIAMYEYRINAGEWQNGNSLSLMNQGGYTIEARAVSNAGLRSEVASSIVKIDKTKPSGSYVFSHREDVWTTDAITIRFTPSDSGGSGIQNVILPNGEYVSDLNDITYKVSRNGDYAFTIIDIAGNTGIVVVKVAHIAVLDVTVTLNTPFVISPDDDIVYGGDVHFENHSNVPVTLTMQGMRPLNDAPQLVTPDRFNWKSLSVKDTKKYIAIGFTGNGKDFWQTDSSQSLGVLSKDSNVTYNLKAKHGYAWENPQSLLYAMTMKVSVFQ